MTRQELTELIKGAGTCIYRGRAYRAEDWEISENGYAAGYLYRLDAPNLWRVVYEPEILSSEYTYRPNEEQQEIGGLAGMIGTKIPKRRYGAEVVPDLTKVISNSTIRKRKAKDGTLKDV